MSPFEGLFARKQALFMGICTSKMSIFPGNALLGGLNPSLYLDPAKTEKEQVSVEKLMVNGS